MVTKILALLENPILRDTFRKAILKALDSIVKEFENDLPLQKKLFDEVILTIQSQIESEESLAVHLENLKSAAAELANAHNRLEFATLGLDSSKVTVEA